MDYLLLPAGLTDENGLAGRTVTCPVRFATHLVLVQHDGAPRLANLLDVIQPSRYPAHWIATLIPRPSTGFALSAEPFHNLDHLLFVHFPSPSC